MKKIIIALAAIAAAFTITSCNKEQLTESEGIPVVGNDVITAFTEGTLTKTSLIGDDTNGYDVVWSDGDTFKIGDNTFTLIEGENTTTGKFQGTLPEGDGPFTAYYPAECNGTDWPTTQVYTAGNITGSPMKAEVVKGAESLSFKNEGGILRLSLKGTDQIRRIIVTADGLNDITLECGSGVTLDPVDGKAFHIAMPEGEYEGASISVYNTDFDCCTKKLKEGKTLKIERSKITTASFTVSFPAPAPIASLTGAFSIAEGKQVCFSRGNLYYDDGFKFESRQCNFHGYDYYSKIWGLFGWSTSTDDTAANNYGMITSDKTSDYSGKFYDWGKAIGDGETWRTLTKDEWTYLLETRPNAAEKYGFGRVYGIYGLIILPDEFTDPMKNNGSGPFKPDMGYSNFYTLGGNWEAMESAGAVFLPIAGYRGGSNVMYDKDFGIYWSSSADGEENAYEMDFQLNSIRPAVSDARRRGHSVRLVTHIASCSVNFDMNGHGTALESLKGIAYGSKITRPSDPTTDGFAFAGWYKDETCTTAWDFDSDVVTANITLYAKWVEGALLGTFSISSTKKVHFSKGNLTYNVSTSIWAFYEHQYDCANGYDANLISLFTWGYNATKSVDPAGTDYVGGYTYDETLRKSEDWGYVFGGKSSVWRTLTRSEWRYLFDNHSYKWATVNGVNGYVIAPDDFAGTIADSYTDDAELAADNLVFLPAANLRNGSSVNIPNIGKYGDYWSSSAYGNNSAYELYFFSSNVNPDSYSSCSLGCSVRLVTEVK